MGEENEYIGEIYIVYFFLLFFDILDGLIIVE